MARSSFVYCRDSGQMIPKSEYLRRKALVTPDRTSSLARPHVIGSMEPIRSMADGRIYDDKRSYEKSLARHGCEVIGFDKNWTDHVKPTYSEKAHEADIVADVKKAIEIESSK
jgi:hypothetical protein